MEQDQKRKQRQKITAIVTLLILGALFIVGIFHGTFFGFPVRTVQAVTSTSTWTDAAGDGTWTNPGNWSPSGEPGSSTIALFSASSTANCSLNEDASVAGITITSGYTGTITQPNSDYIYIGTSGYSQAGGTFTGGSTTNSFFWDNGTFSFTGGTFIIPVGTTWGTPGLRVDQSATISSLLNDANDGGGQFYATTTITTSTTFYTLTIGGGGGDPNPSPYMTVATGTVITVQSSTFFDPNQGFVYLEGGGQIDAQGSVVLLFSQSTGYGSTIIPATSTFNFILDGTGTQTISDGGLGGLNYAAPFFLPGNFVISKSSGTVNLSGDIGITGNFINTNGTTINPGTSTVLDWNNVASGTITGTSTFNNLLFSAYNSSTVTISTGTTLTVLGNLDLAVYKFSINNINIVGGGTIDDQGNIETDPVSYYPTNTLSLIMDGTGTQTIGDDFDCTTIASVNCYWGVPLPDLTINKTNGSVVLANNIMIESNFINTNGTMINPGTSTIIFGQGDAQFSQTGVYGVAYDQYFPSGTSTFTLTGSSTFYNLIIGDWNSAVGNVFATIATGTTITVQGDFELSNCDDYTQIKGGGAIDMQGNILSGDCPWTGQGSFLGVGAPSIIVNGTGTQIIGLGSLNSGIDLYLPNLTVQKSSGVAYGESAATIYSSSTIAQGEFQLSTGTSATSFIQRYGAFTINSGARLSDYPVATSTFEPGAGVVNNGTVFFSGDGEGCALPLPNYIVINTASGTTSQAWSGTGNFIMRYASVKRQTTSGPAAINDVNGTNAGNNSGSWTFTTAGRPALVQSVSASSTSASSLTLPFTFYPRAGDLILVAVSANGQSITAPTDNASNTYTLITSNTLSASPNGTLSLYYAKSINTTSSFMVTANGTGGGPLSAAAFEYTSINPSSTFQTYIANSDNSGTATNLTSLSATGNSSNELYFGAMTLATSTIASAGSTWTSALAMTNNTGYQDLYAEYIATTTELTTAATWTSVASTSYGAIMGIFTSPYTNGYSASGTLDSATFDTGIASGTQLNSFTWQGSTPSNSAVDFQFAVSNSSNGPWNFEGYDGTANTYFSGAAGFPISLVSNTTAQGYELFSGYRYFRYRVFLFSDSTYSYTPTVSGVTVNWSP